MRALFKHCLSRRQSDKDKIQQIELEEISFILIERRNINEERVSIDQDEMKANGHVREK